MRAFVQALLPQPTEADALLEKGDVVSLFAARDLEPGREDVAVALAAELLEQDRAGEALTVLAAFPEVGEVGHLAAKARLVVAGRRPRTRGPMSASRTCSAVRRTTTPRARSSSTCSTRSVPRTRAPRSYRRALASRLF